MAGLCPWERVVGMKWQDWGLIILVVAIMLALFFCPKYVKADPPHPSKNHKFEAWANGTIILHFQQDGYRQKFMYQQLSPPEAATACINRYYDSRMELITFSQSLPVWYSVDIRPFMRWTPIKQEWVKFE